MQVPSILQGESLTRLMQGIAIGAVATMFIGFYWGGWVTGSTAWKMAQRDAKEATIAALAPICVDKFQRAANASEKLIELNKIRFVWDRDVFIEMGGWATMPGATAPDTAVAQACAEMLLNQSKLKSVI
jgi:hypothetical protein